MRREQSNQIRFILEELLPPILRDTALFKFAASLAWGKHISTLAEFRKSAPFLTAGTIQRTLSHASARSRGHRQFRAPAWSASPPTRSARASATSAAAPARCSAMCASIRARNSARWSASTSSRPTSRSAHGIEFVSGWVEDLPFADKSFDTVVCTHVIEHILDYRDAIAELRRIARRRLIIVVPREREGIYTFNPHFNFFPYSHSFLRAMIPVPASHVCEDIGRDIYYREDLSAAAAEAA